MMSNSVSRRTAARVLYWLLAATMIFGIAGLLLFLAGVFHPKVPREAVDAELPTADGLKVVPVRRISQPRYETASGTVRPVHESAVASRLLARVLQVDITAGQEVRQDQILVRLDDAELRARVSQSEAALSNATTRRDQASSDLQRAELLKQKNAITQAEFDAATTALKSADAAVIQATEAMREAQVHLDDAIVRAPMSGTVVDKKINEGDMVIPGQVMLTLFDPTHMQMVASVRESLALRLKPGQVLPTRLDSLNLDCESTISELVPEADAASRSFTVKVTGPCPPGAFSGMFGRLLIPLEDEQVLVIPPEATRRIGQLTLCSVVKDNHVVRRYVRTGRLLEGGLEVLSGLEEGESVAVLPAHGE